MSCLHILIDSSTSKTKRRDKTVNYGKSTAFWCAFWNEIKGIPCRAGLIYNDYQGPNKIFFDGIIRALEACYYLVRAGSTVKVYGDCMSVLKVLSGERTARKMEPLYNQVEKLKEKYRGEITFEYMGDDNEIYKKVDECASQFKNNLIQKFNQS